MKGLKSLLGSWQANPAFSPKPLSNPSWNLTLGSQVKYKVMNLINNHRGWDWVHLLVMNLINGPVKTCRDQLCVVCLYLAKSNYISKQRPCDSQKGIDKAPQPL